MSRRSAALTFPTWAIRIGLFALRHETKATHLYLSHIQKRHQRGRSAMIAPTGPVVSLTTYGERLKSVHLVLESIAAGELLPSRLILWVDTPEAFANPPDALKKQIDRGLEIRLSDNFGPHTKYFPYLLSENSLNLPLVTADDDLLYSRWWLEGLVQSQQENPADLICYRAHRMRLTGENVAPYRTWQKCKSDRPSYLHFPTGVSGCIYPAALQKALKSAGLQFVATCPKADDVWIHVNALRAGIKIKQVRNHPLRFPFVPGTQESGLYHSNVIQDRNDEQIRSTYSKADIHLLHSTTEAIHPT